MSTLRQCTDKEDTMGVQYMNVPVEIDENVLRQIAQTADGQYYRATSNSKLKEVYEEIDKGMMVENLVAQMLIATDKKLYYYTNPYKEDASERMEIDFLIRKSTITSKHNICPIEVKSTQRYTTSSLDKFRDKFKAYLHTSYIVHSGNLKVENGIVYLPLYMTAIL